MGLAGPHSSNEKTTPRNCANRSVAVLALFRARQLNLSKISFKARPKWPVRETVADATSSEDL